VGNVGAFHREGGREMTMPPTLVIGYGTLNLYFIVPGEWPPHPA